MSKYHGYTRKTNSDEDFCKIHATRSSTGEIAYNTVVKKKEMYAYVIKSVPYLLILLPVAFAFLFVHTFGVNLAFWDQWDIVPLFDKFFSGTLNLADFFAQHNEHRIFFPRIAMLLLGVTTAYNTVAEMYLILTCFLAVLIVLFLAFKVDTRYQLFLFVPVPFLLFSLRQHENMLNGVQIMIGFVILFSVLTFYCLYVSREAKFRRLGFPAALVSATIASFSFAQGLLVWPIGVLQLLAIPAERSAKRLIIGVWSSIGLVEWIVYFFDYTKPPEHPSLFYVLFHPIAGVGYFLTSLGSSLFWQESTALVGGLLLVCLAAVVVSVVHKDRNTNEYSFWLVLLLFSFIYLASITVARSGYDIMPPTTSRYTVFSILAFISIYAMLAKLTVERKGGVFTFLLGGVIVLVLLSVAVSYVEGVSSGKEIEASLEKQAFITLTYKTQPDELLTSLYPYPEDLRERAPILERLGYNVFSEPPEEVLLPPLAELSPVPSSTPSDIDTVNDQPVSTQQSQPVVVSEEEPYIKVGGWAVDSEAKEVAGGVYLDVDGELFPAFYGTERRDVLRSYKKPAYRNSGFERYIPTSQVGPGEHELSIIVLTHDRKGYYRSEEKLALDVESK